MNYWLLKTEPSVYGIEDLIKEKNSTDHWDGVRNYQARNFMRDNMKKGDLCFFYHSNCDVPGIVGIVEISKESYPDFTAWDESSKYYDSKSTKENLRWFMVDVTYKRTLNKIISLKELQKYEKELDGFPLIRKGNRLSIIPVSKDHWDFILSLE